MVFIFDTLSNPFTPITAVATKASPSQVNLAHSSGVIFRIPFTCSFQ